MPICHHASMSLCQYVIMPVCRHASMSSCQRVIMPACHQASVPSDQHVIRPACHQAGHLATSPFGNFFIWPLLYSATCSFGNFVIRKLLYSATFRQASVFSFMRLQHAARDIDLVTSASVLKSLILNEGEFFCCCKKTPFKIIMYFSILS